LRASQEYYNELYLQAQKEADRQETNKLRKLYANNTIRCA